MLANRNLSSSQAEISPISFARSGDDTPTERLVSDGDASGIKTGPRAAIRTSRLSMVYRIDQTQIRAVDRIDLEVPAGQFVIGRGRSGSGKSTLLHLVAGLQAPTGGSVLIDGVNLHALARRECDRFRRMRLGIVFQFFNLVPSLTVEMNVALPLMLEGKRLPDVHDRVVEILDALGMAHRMEHSPHQLSGGEMQRVAIARALVAQPALILADEPTGNLDSATSHEVFALLADQTRKRGIAALVMTHDTDVLGFADRVIEISDGRIQRDSGP
jgi:putative ABC transport system ATP-binding protein